MLRHTHRAITLWVEVNGPIGSTQLLMALDTGATFVTIPTRTAMELGYDIAHPVVTTPMVTPSGMSQAPLIELAYVEALGAQATEVRAICIDLPRAIGFDGLLGLSFLRNFDIDLHFRSGLIEFR